VRNEAADELRDEVSGALPTLGLLSEKEAATPPAPGRWSPKQIIGHLVDSAFTNHGRFVRAQGQDDLVFPGYAQDRWVEAQRYQDRSWRELVRLWEHVNLHLAWVMESAPASERTRPRRTHNLHEIGFRPVPPAEPATLEQLMLDYVEHLRHHLRQVRECAKT
jgi:hypothetical protein